MEFDFLTVQDSKRSERRPNKEEKAAGRPPAVSVDAVEGADRTSATVTTSPTPPHDKKNHFSNEVIFFVQMMFVSN